MIEREPNSGFAACGSSGGVFALASFAAASLSTHADFGWSSHNLGSASSGLQAKARVG